MLLLALLSPLTMESCKSGKQAALQHGSWPALLYAHLLLVSAIDCLAIRWPLLLQPRSSCVLFLSGQYSGIRLEFEEMVWLAQIPALVDGILDARRNAVHIANI